MSQASMPDGPPSSLEDLFREHGPRIYRVAYRVTGNPSDAEDVVQTIFLRLLRREDREDDIVLGPAVTGYLHRAAVNAGLDLLRSRQRARAVPLPATDEESELEELDPSARPQSRVERGELGQRLRSALAKLNPRAAEIFALRYFEGLGNTEIADQLGTSRSAIAVTLHRSRIRLKEELGMSQGEMA